MVLGILKIRHTLFPTNGGFIEFQALEVQRLFLRTGMRLSVWGLALPSSVSNRRCISNSSFAKTL